MNFLDRFSRNTQLSNFMKILPVGAEFLPAADGQEDITQLVANFRNFLKAPKKE